MLDNTSKARVGREKNQAFNLQKPIQGQRMHFYHCLSLTQSVLIPPVETGGLRIGLRIGPTTFLPFSWLGHTRKYLLVQKAPQRELGAFKHDSRYSDQVLRRRGVCVSTHTPLHERGCGGKGEDKNRLKFNRFDGRRRCRKGSEMPFLAEGWLNRAETLASI
jgi:hypothetical protein